ncbi:MAG TPA: DUF4129 domain-containing protein [Thermoplasmata archaeon]|nr:DUF4129 domain-containing protein [Thermoplasmata archaeon]
MPSAFRGRTVWVIPLLLFLAILLVAGLAFNLAHLDTGGEQLPATPGSGSPIANPQGLLDPDTAAVLLVATFIAFVVSAIVLVFLKKKGPRVKRIVRPIGWADVLATLIAFVVFAGLIYLYPHLVSSVNPQAGGSNGTAGGAGDTTLIPAVGGIPLGVFLAGAIFASILAIALFLQVGANLRRLRPVGPASRSRRLAARTLEKTMAELELGADVRQAILACYQRFCLLLGARGIGAQDSLTPRELEDLAVRRLAVSGDSAEALTSLFEEARYSEHPLADGDRDRALRSLETIRADLEA